MSMPDFLAIPVPPLVGLVTKELSKLLIGANSKDLLRPPDG